MQTYCHKNISEEEKTRKREYGRIVKEIFVMKKRKKIESERNHNRNVSNHKKEKLKEYNRNY